MMSSAEKALIEDGDKADNLQGVNLNNEADISRRKDTKYSWFVCFCTFISQVLVLGVLHAFGVFFVEFVKEFDSPKGEAAWIGSLAYGLSMTFGPVTSIMVSRFGYRRIMMTGGLICSLSLIASSFATSMPMLFLTFSVSYGVGTCMCTSPTMTITTEYFEKYLSVATGITVSGSSFGTLIMGPLSQAIIDGAGWRTAFRIYAGLVLVTIALNSRIRPLEKLTKRKAERSLLSDLQIWKSRVFVIWVMSIALVMFGFYIPYVHLVSYAIDRGVSPDMASLLMLILGASTAFGRIVFGKIVQYGILNRLHMHQLSMMITGTGVMVLPLITSYTGIVMYVVTVGLVDGCFVVLLPIMTASLVGIEKSVLAWGFMIGTSSITFTLGPPVAGALYDMTGSYDVAFHIAGVPIIAGSILLFLIPWAQRTSDRTHVLDIVTDYAISNTQDVGGAVCKTESAGTICAGTDGEVDKVRYRSIGTSPTQIYTTDRSTSTTELTGRRVSMDVVDTLAQLSNADRVLGQMLAQTDAQTVTGAQSMSPQQDVEIPKLPPPSDPVRYKRAGQSQGRDSAHSSYTSSYRERPSASTSHQHSLASDSLHSGQNSDHVTDTASLYSDQLLSSCSGHFVPVLDSTEAFNDNLSSMQLPFNVPAVPEQAQMPYQQYSQVSPNSSHRSSVASPASLSRGVSPMPIRHGTVVRQPESMTSPKQEASNFDQTISEQVTKIIDTLRSPTGQEFDIDNDVGVATERTSMSPRSDRTRSQPISTQSSIRSQSSALSALMDQQTSSENSGEDDVERPAPDSVSTEDTTFYEDNQQTVIRGNNPFVPGGQSSNRPGGTTHLQSLFSDVEQRVVEEASSLEALDSCSNERVRPTKSQTGELDVFKHLFEDNDEDGAK